MRATVSPDFTVTLSLGGSAADLIDLTGAVRSQFLQMFDLYVLKDWPVREVARTLTANIAQVYLTKHRVTSLIKQETEKLRKRMEAEG